MKTILEVLLYMLLAYIPGAASIIGIDKACDRVEWCRVASERGYVRYAQYSTDYGGWYS